MLDRYLVAKLQKGNLNALDQIIDRYSAYLCAIAYNILGENLGAEDVEEIVSDSFTTLWYTREKVKPSSLKSYLATLTRNGAIDRLRSLHTTMPLEEDIAVAECEGPEAEALKKELSLVARDAVNSLPEPDREIFQRHYFLYQKTDEIADDMNIKPSTVRVKLLRGREKLRLYLQNRGIEYENTCI